MNRSVAPDGSRSGYGLPSGFLQQEYAMPKALAITHLAFEDLGSLAPELAAAGFAVDTVDACTADFRGIDPLAPDLVIVLGGPIGVYEADRYPFILEEIALIRARLREKRPTLGICFGAQLIAAAAGARVYPGSQGKEIGWFPIHAARDSAGFPAFTALFEPGLRLLHWHGDTFDLPPAAHHLASTTAYPNQAFALGRHALGLQFHPEAIVATLERWYVGHAAELAHAGIEVNRLRAESREFGAALEHSARKFWSACLIDLDLRA